MDREEAPRKNLEGQKLLDAGQYDEAIRLFSEAIESDANYAAAWLNRSDANRCLGREAEADADKERGESLIRAAPTQPTQQLGVNRRSVYQGGGIGAVTFIFGYTFLHLFFDWNWWQMTLGVIVLTVFVEGVYFVLVKIGFL